MEMDTTLDKTALETIDLLEARLKRIQYAVYGHVNHGALSGTENASTRMRQLEGNLHQLASKSRVIQDLLRLRGCSIYFSF